VTEIHDLHIWQITSGMPAASAHVLVANGEDCHAVRADLEAVLAQAYKITHRTLQVDHAPSPAGGADPGHCEESHGPVHRPTGLGAG
jgi:cobalt-zinc-cadmium efflux system protein